MAVTDLPILSMLRTKMQWHQARQKLIAENVANADMPGFKPRDLAQPRFGSATGELAQRQRRRLPGADEPAHIATRPAATASGPTRAGQELRGQPERERRSISRRR